MRKGFVFLFNSRFLQFFNVNFLFFFKNYRNMQAVIFAFCNQTHKYNFSLSYEMEHTKFEQSTIRNQLSVLILICNA